MPTTLKILFFYHFYYLQGLKLWNLWSLWVTKAAFSNFSFNTLRPRQNGRRLADDVFKCIFLSENVWILIKISLKFVPRGLINNILSLVQVMAWHRLGDKPLSETMIVKLPTHICVTQPQWVKEIFILPFNSAAVEVWDCVSNFTPHFMCEITYPLKSLCAMGLLLSGTTPFSYHKNVLNKAPPTQTVTPLITILRYCWTEMLRKWL